MDLKRHREASAMVNTTATYAIVFLVLLLFFGFNAIVKENRRKWIIKENMPLELREGKLVASEQYISTDSPRKLHGTLDQLYRLKTGEYVLVDSKTRSKKRVYLYDIVQLSGYKLLLECTGKKMAPYAYVRVVTEEGVSYIKKTLLTEAQYLEKYDRVGLVLAKKVTPTTVRHRSMCNGCGQQENCHAWRYEENKVERV